MDEAKREEAERPAHVTVNPDGSLTFHHPIDDVFAWMVKNGMIKPKDQA